jgi:dipeptidyl aminopeptidase/acylaminoacyl peptidase
MLRRPHVALACLVATSLLASPLDVTLEAQARPAANTIVVETVTYGSGANALSGLLARPSALQGRAPGILVMHGGENSGLQRAMQWLIERLAARGYVALSGTYRATQPANDLADCRLALDFLASLAYVDAERIGMTGQSRGAGNSFRTALADRRVKSISPIAGGGGGIPGAPVRNELALSESRYMRGIRTAGGYPEERPPTPDRRAVRPANPLELQIPALVIQGTWDLFAPAEGAILLKEAVRAAGVSHIKVNVIPGMGHFFDTPKGVLLDEIAALQADWFDETLQGRKTGRDFERPLDLPDTAAFPASAGYGIRELTYPSGGHEVRAYLVEPRERRSGRVVLYAPGGHTGADASRLGFLIKALGEAGHTVMITSYRGPVADVTDEADISAALDYLSGRPGIPGSFTAIGHGRGGMAVLRAAAKDRRIGGVVSLSAPSNVTRLIKGLRAYSPASADFQASRLAPPERYTAISPAYFAREIKVPVLLIHGSLDLMVPPEHLLWNAMDLMATGNSHVEMFMAPWDTHFYDSTFAFSKPEQWVGRITAWIERTGTGS